MLCAVGIYAREGFFGPLVPRTKNERDVMLEKEIERKFKKALEAKGCLVYKFASPNCRGVPDRIVITDTGRVLFVELKTEKGVLSKLQRIQLKKLRDFRQKTFVLYGLPEVEDFVNRIEDWR